MVACATSDRLSNVKSFAMTPRHPSVPKRIRTNHLSLIRKQKGNKPETTDECQHSGMKLDYTMDFSNYELSFREGRIVNILLPGDNVAEI
jgi:hypothetical protein